MKKLLMICGFLVLVASACKKDSSDDYPAQQAIVDDTQIQAYIAANKIVATKDPSGVYYSVLTPGTGAYPTVNSTLTVNYRGEFINGNVFDSGNLSNFNLNGVIKGWYYGVPHINTGGRILLMIPSGLAYGQQGQGTIPANTVLVFTIDLLSFK
ncbi:FKBP-type peptidyl-prolyl cis-trans isomerase [Mucilaginibacter galii]|uniref:Peptidyl-prolyl cis-trans isomerase n=1 Tax=Mucilaginibacter galii TaxID=2005073 RepID=A0A917N291_9SPHI|nr:FKBP-type peptidyl-prolyl cis-trans isomerase [Mucilaginibacter galii]GGI49822.1 peptidyl-prolyl cis-trans isomerase [Mucilaginibacter galii]